MNQPQQSRSFGAILDATFNLYSQHWWTLTRPLLKPVLLQLTGCYGSVVGVYAILWWFQYAPPAWLPDDLTWRLVLILGIPLAVCLLFLLLFVDGVWRYLVVMASLCRNVDNIEQGNPADIPGAIDHVQQQALPYTTLLLAVGLIQTVFFLPALVLPFAGLPLGASITVTILALCVGGVLFALSVVFFSMTLPIVALETVPVSPESVLRKSILSIARQFWLATGLLVTISLLCSLATPILAQIFSILLIGGFLTQIHSWLLTQLDQQIPLLASLVSTFTQMGQTPPAPAEIMDILAHGLTSLTLNMIAGALLYPLMAIVLTLLYQNSLARPSHPPATHNKQL